jgi:hypothetical protein
MNQGVLACPLQSYESERIRNQKCERVFEPLRMTFTDRISCIVERERGKQTCPLQFSQSVAETCPVAHKNWPQAGVDGHYAHRHRRPPALDPRP